MTLKIPCGHTDNELDREKDLTSIIPRPNNLKRRMQNIIVNTLRKKERQLDSICAQLQHLHDHLANYFFLGRHRPLPSSVQQSKGLGLTCKGHFARKFSLVASFHLRSRFVPRSCSPSGTTPAENLVHLLYLFFLLSEDGAVQPSLNPFFSFLGMFLRWRILPVPVPVRLFALRDQLTIKE